MSRNYNQVYKDWSYLWAIGPANDMTGGYVDQEDLQRMLENPTKKMAIRCLTSQIDHWFSDGMEPISTYEGGLETRIERIERLLKEDPEIQRIKDEYI